MAARRQIADGQVSEPVPPRGSLLLLQRHGDVTAVASEVGSLYGPRIEEFTRVWIQAGPHVLFVIDRIGATRPVRTVWNWLLNNRDGASDFHVHNGRTLTMRRGLAGMRLTHMADGRFNGPVYAVMHDAYHPEPDRQGEGHSGSGMLYRWIEPEACTSRLAVHAIAVDDYGLIDHWSTEQAGDSIALTCREQQWTLTVESERPLDATLRSKHEPKSWKLTEQSGELHFAENGKE